MKIISLQILEIKVMLHVLRYLNGVLPREREQTRGFREIIFKPEGLFILPFNL